MNTNVTQLDTAVVVVHSLIEYTLVIPWFYLLFLVWICLMYRCLRSKYESWAWDEINQRWGNPAPLLTTQIHPSEAGDIQLLTNYRQRWAGLAFFHFVCSSFVHEPFRQFLFQLFKTNLFRLFFKIIIHFHQIRSFSH